MLLRENRGKLAFLQAVATVKTLVGKVTGYPFLQGAATPSHEQGFSIAPAQPVDDVEPFRMLRHVITLESNVEPAIQRRGQQHFARSGNTPLVHGGQEELFIQRNRQVAAQGA